MHTVEGGSNERREREREKDENGLGIRNSVDQCICLLFLILIVLLRSTIAERRRIGTFHTYVSVKKEKEIVRLFFRSPYKGFLNL